MEHERTWIVGLDLSARSQGAIRLAHWLHHRSATQERLLGVHVFSGTKLQRGQPGAGLPVDRARDLARASATALQADAAFESFEALPGDAPEQTLAQVVDERRADGLIVGRSATIAGWSLVSLGRVTRRLLRRVPRPMLIAPPDLDPQTLGRGPIVVGVTPWDDALEAARAARTLSRDLDLPLVFVHVMPGRTVFPAVGLDPALAYGTTVSDPAPSDIDDPEDLQAWLSAHDLADVPVRTVTGRRSARLLEEAQALDATMIVCGSRRLSLTERIFQASTSSDLAAHADRPVYVVAPQ